MGLRLIELDDMLAHAMQDTLAGSRALESLVEVGWSSSMFNLAVDGRHVIFTSNREPLRRQTDDMK